MALKSLGELTGVKQYDISCTSDRMTIGRTSVYFLDIPDTFEENPEDAITEDAITEDEEENDDDE